MEHYYVKIYSDFREKVRDFDIVKCEGLADYYKEIECSCIETAPIYNSLKGKYKDFPSLLIIDENGKLDGKGINIIASFLFSNPCDFIVGNCLLAKIEGEDFCGYTEEECEKIIQELKEYFKIGENSR